MRHLGNNNASGHAERSMTTSELSRREKRLRDAKVRILESGHIAFLYRPQTSEAQSVNDVARLQIVLQPHEQRLFRVLNLHGYRLPEVRRRGEAVPGSLELWRSPHTLQLSLGTKPKLLDSARMAGEGVYCIVRHSDHLHLIHALTLPAGMGRVQKDLNMERQGSYILGLPQTLDADTQIHEFLNTKNASFTFIGANEDVEGELGIDLEPELREHATKELRKATGVKTLNLEPMFAGTWR